MAYTLSLLKYHQIIASNIIINAVYLDCSTGWRRFCFWRLPGKGDREGSFAESEIAKVEYEVLIHRKEQEMKKVIVVAILVTFCTTLSLPRKAIAGDVAPLLKYAMIGIAVGGLIVLVSSLTSTKNEISKENLKSELERNKSNNSNNSEMFAANDFNNGENKTILQYTLEFKFWVY